MAFLRMGSPFLHRICGLSTVILLCVSGVPARPPGNPAGTPAAQGRGGKPAAAGAGLSSFLDRAADYCDGLSRAVLNFVCRETIDERFYVEEEAFNERFDIFFIGEHEKKFTYVNDYQLVRDRAGHIQETRTLIEEQGKKTNIPKAPLKTHIFKHAYVVMGPVGLLGREHQPNFDYRIAREEKVGGEPAVVIESVPKPGVRLDYLFGKVWLRKRDAGIVKIQWSPASMENYEAVEREAQKLGWRPDIVMTSEYAFEKNGIRFPSRYTVKENYMGRHGGHFERSKTVVLYDQYKFFTVETDVKF